MNSEKIFFFVMARMEYDIVLQHKSPRNKDEANERGKII